MLINFDQNQTRITGFVSKNGLVKPRSLLSSCLLAASSMVALTGTSMAASDCTQKTTAPLKFIVLKGNADDAAVEDDIRANLLAVNMNVTTHFLEKAAFNTAMTTGDFNLCFSETWGPPYDPHTYAASWKSPDEAHYAAFKGLTAPFKTQAQLSAEISAVLTVESVSERTAKWRQILGDVHKTAVDLPFSGKRNPAVVNRRLSGYTAGQQQFDYPMHTFQVVSGSKTATVAPGAQSGLFSTVGRLDPHTYRPNEFFANNWVYEGLVSYGADGNIDPALATSWTFKDLPSGGQEYTFALRQGVKFHDGSAWDCSVAKLNFDHVFAAPLTTADWHGWYDLPKTLTSWTCKSTTEFVLTTKTKYYPLLQELSYIRPLRMLSPKMFKNGAGTDPLTDNSCHVGWNPATGKITGNGVSLTCAGTLGVSGTGPWEYKGTDAPTGEATFQRNANWWKQAPTAASIDVLTIKKYADHSAVQAAVISGELDIVMGSGVLTPTDFTILKTTQTAKVHTFLGPVLQNRLVIINSNKAPTTSFETRKTIIHAVNKAAIIDKELKGLAEPVDALFPKNAPYCNVDLTPRWDYDIQKAKLLNCAPVPAPTSTTVEGEVGGGMVALVVIGVLVVLAVPAVIFATRGKAAGKSELFQELKGMDKDEMFARVQGNANA